jgi:hypothetical protein
LIYGHGRQVEGIMRKTILAYAPLLPGINAWMEAEGKYFHDVPCSE